jgi:hypothetical protein
MSAQEAVYDPYNSADNATLRPQAYYAMVQSDAWPCVLIKGKGKVAFNAQEHKVGDRVTAIDISLQPLAEQNVNFPLVRNMIAESPAWIKIVMPSFKALGLASARELNGKWAKVEMVPSGRKYEKKDRNTGRTTGEMVEETTFKFLAFYKDEAEARAAYLGGASQPEATAPTTAPASANSAERATALAFLKALLPKWAPTGQEMAAVEKGIAANPVLARHFNIQSPEVIDLLVAQASK